LTFSIKGLMTTVLAATVGIGLYDPAEEKS
jgi:hypothetical protein